MPWPRVNPGLVLLKSVAPVSRRRPTSSMFLSFPASRPVRHKNRKPALLFLHLLASFFFTHEGGNRGSDYYISCPQRWSLKALMTTAFGLGSCKQEKMLSRYSFKCKYTLSLGQWVVRMWPVKVQKKNNLVKLLKGQQLWGQSGVKGGGENPLLEFVGKERGRVDAGDGAKEQNSKDAERKRVPNFNWSNLTPRGWTMEHLLAHKDHAGCFLNLPPLPFHCRGNRSEHVTLQ